MSGEGKPSLAMIDRADPSIHADHPEHHTRKSHASLERDKPKHSGKINAKQHGIPRKHGHGKGNVGVAGEEYEDEVEGGMELDPRDPDYEDPRDADVDADKGRGEASAAGGGAEKDSAASS